jgi:hypothetical protein
MSAPALERLRSALGDRYAIDRELGSGAMATVYSRATSSTIATSR